MQLPFAYFVLALVAFGDEPLPLVPQPHSVRLADGGFKLPTNVGISAPVELRTGASYLGTRLKDGLGHPVSLDTSGPVKLSIASMQPEHVEYQAYPRAVALAETTWTVAANKNFKSFRKRLITHARRLDEMNVNYRKLEPFPPIEWDSSAIRPARKEVILDGKLTARCPRQLHRHPELREQSLRSLVRQDRIACRRQSHCLRRSPGLCRHSSARCFLHSHREIARPRRSCSDPSCHSGQP